MTRALLKMMPLFAWLLAGAATAGPPQAFEADSPAAIAARYAGRPYVLAFWSLECGHCQKELRVLADVSSRHPDLPLVLVSADAPELAAAVSAHLAALGLAAADNWLFADPAPERLRYAVDRKWRGELPRTYLYDGDGSVRVVSGTLGEAQLWVWLASRLP